MQGRFVKFHGLTSSAPPLGCCLLAAAAAPCCMLLLPHCTAEAFQVLQPCNGSNQQVMVNHCYAALCLGCTNAEPHTMYAAAAVESHTCRCLHALSASGRAGNVDSATPAFRSSLKRVCLVGGNGGASTASSPVIVGLEPAGLCCNRCISIM
jgi:hypothetical protein